MHLPCLGALPVAPPWRAAEMSEPRKPGMTSCVWRRHPDSAADRAGPRWTALDPGPTALDSYCRRAAAELRRRLPPTDALDRAGPRDSHPRLARVASRGRLGQMCKVLDRAGVLRGLRTKRPLFLTFPHFSSLFSFLKRGLAAVPPNLSTMGLIISGGCHGGVNARPVAGRPRCFISCTWGALPLAPLPAVGWTPYGSRRE